ncbi:MAG: immunoglobulin domain-containing protein [Planctomycetota bacterium]
MLHTDEIKARRLLRTFGVMLILLFLGAGPVWAITFTFDTTINAGDTTYDNDDITVDGCTLTVNGAHPFNSLHVMNGGVVTHSLNDDTQEYTIDLTIATDVSVDATSRIDVNARGYTCANGPGAGTSSNYGAGGGYGGEGGFNENLQAGGAAYGSIIAPTDIGSGGGGGYLGAIGGSGGGAIRLQVTGTLQIDGQISAVGGNAQTYAGGGSGGSIYLTVGTLAGNGTISATGGTRGPSGGAGGGGGRIAIHYDSDSFAGTITACGASGYQYGGAGTIYQKDSGSATGALSLSNCGNSGALTPLTSPEAFDVTIGENAAVYPSGTPTIGNLNVAAGGMLTHPAEDTGFNLTVQGDATVDANGMISVDAKGYPAGTGPGAGTNSDYGAGAGYGGDGGQGNSGAFGGSAYGSITAPVELGSGGGWGYLDCPGGTGGGAIRLQVTGTLQLEGQINANGASGVNYAGGGSGGSIYLTVGTLAGPGSIAASGGSSGPQGGSGGGGGRIAIVRDTNSFAGTITVCGASGFEYGGAGTLYVRDAGSPTGTLSIGNCGNAGAWTPLTSPEAFDVTISDYAIVYPTDTPTIGNLLVGAAGMLTHHAETATFDLTVQADATIEAGGAISVDGMGYLPATGPGAGTSSNYGAGAGHGGLGGQGDSGAPGGAIYGSAAAPTDFGSGGGGGFQGSVGGTGGGAIRMNVAGTLQVDGQISADGGNAQSYAGGGSGGSVYLYIGTLAGTGTISANGGDRGPNGGGGGAGGRIAYFCCDVQMDPGLITADGGLGFENGQPGTILQGSPYIQITQQPDGATVFPGDPFTVSVTASTTLGDLTYQWRKDGVDLVDDEHISGVTTDTLTIDPSDPADSGYFDV